MTKLELQIELEQEIEREAAACRAALKDSKVGDLVGHCHHREFLEILNEPAEKRISYILAKKPKKEQPERLRRFRPIDPKKIPSGLKKARAEWEKACTEWDKVRDEWEKAYAELTKANAKKDKAYAEFTKANDKLDKARAEGEKARDNFETVLVKWNRGTKKFKFHTEVCDCPWGVGIDIFGTDIFGG